MGLPVDAAQPWEELDANGFVVPVDALATRGINSINLSTSFTQGFDRFDEEGDVTEFEDASRIASGNAGEGGFGAAIYRIPLGGDQPGVVAVDVNMRQRTDLSPSEYYVGIADYGKNTWDWHGPFMDSHVRIGLPAGNYLSLLGNHFVCVAGYDGSIFDVVGIGINTVNAGDTTAPSAPAAPVLTPIAGGLLIEWLAVADPDLAGYQIFYDDQTFIDGSTTGVSRVNMLEGNTNHILKGLTGVTFVRIAAVDASGNLSPVSGISSATPLAGTSGPIQVVTNHNAGLLGGNAELTLTGADSYDIDLDGDGSFDVFGDVTGSAIVPFNATGIIRPLVRGFSGGVATAQGAVSLLVAGNSRPVASASASTYKGPAPLAVSFTGIGDDFDGSIAEYAWDWEGDGIYDYLDGSAPNPVGPYVYDTPGTYNAKFRVTDDLGAWDVDTITIQVLDRTGWDWYYPIDDNSSGDHFSFAIVDGNPAFAYRSASSDSLWYTRALDSAGRLWDEPLEIDSDPNSGEFVSLAVINGNPAVAYVDFTIPELCFLRADDSTGSSWTTPRVILDNVTSFSDGIALAEVAGNPAIAYAEAALVNMHYIRADSPDGSTWGNVAVLIDGSGNVFGNTQLAIVQGNPAIIYANLNRAFYIRAGNSTGDLLADWPNPPVNVSGAADNGTGKMGFTIAGGNPAICYWETTTDELVYHRASNATGQTSLDWPGGYLVVDDGITAGLNCDMAIINGRPAICYYSFAGFNGFWYREANNPEGTDWGPRQLTYTEVTNFVGPDSVMLEHNGEPLILSMHSSYFMPFLLRPSYE